MISEALSKSIAIPGMVYGAERSRILPEVFLIVLEKLEMLCWQMALLLSFRTWFLKKKPFLEPSFQNVIVGF